MRSFRVYNRVRKVGVTFRIGGIEIGIASMTGLFAILVAVIAVAGITSFVAPPAAVVAIVIVGLVAMLVAFIMVARLTNMSKLRESTQLRLITGTMRERRYKNFSTPDANFGVNDDGDPFSDAASVYRNF